MLQPNLWPQLQPNKKRKPAKAAVTASAVKAAVKQDEMVAEVVVMGVAVSAAKAQQAKCALPEKLDAAAKAASKAVKVKPAPLALSDRIVVSVPSEVSVPNVVNAPSAQTVIALPVKAAVITARAYVAKIRLKASAPTA